MRHASRLLRQGVSLWLTRGSFFGLTSKILPLGSMLNFDADVKKMAAHHQCENRFTRQVSYVMHALRSYTTWSVCAASEVFLYAR